MNTFTDIDAYIGSFAPEQQNILKEMRNIIRQAAPEAQEAISYGMPTFKLNGNLVHFALAKKHLGFYPGTSAVKAFEKSLITYKTSKGGIQFPLNMNLPEALIADIVNFGVKENSNK